MLLFFRPISNVLFSLALLIGICAFIGGIIRVLCCMKLPLAKNALWTQSPAGIVLVAMNSSAWSRQPAIGKSMLAGGVLILVVLLVIYYLWYRRKKTRSTIQRRRVCTYAACTMLPWNCDWTAPLSDLSNQTTTAAASKEVGCRQTKKHGHPWRAWCAGTRASMSQWDVNHVDLTCKTPNVQTGQSSNNTSEQSVTDESSQEDGAPGSIDAEDDAHLTHAKSDVSIDMMRGNVDARHIVQRLKEKPKYRRKGVRQWVEPTIAVFW